MNALTHTVRSILRPRGWEMRRFDPDLSLDTYLWTLFTHLRINCVLDVGGRYGDYGILLRNNGYGGHILSFEPVSENVRRLEERSASDPDWRVYPYALGSENGTAEINVSRGTNYSSFLSPSSYGMETNPGIAVEQKETVQVRRLDDVFAEVTAHIEEPRVYLKMDTQGFDVEVFRGAHQSLERIFALQSEVSLQPLYEGMPDWTTALSEFGQKGYAVSAFFAGFRDQQLRLSEMDCVMVRV